MRAGDILGSEVYDGADARLGKVTDIRAVQDGPVRRGLQSALRVDALVVGRAGLAERLGFIRNCVEGPALVRWFFVRLERRARLVDVHDVEDWDLERDRIRLRSGALIRPLEDDG